MISTEKMKRLEHLGSEKKMVQQLYFKVSKMNYWDGVYIIFNSERKKKKKQKLMESKGNEEVDFVLVWVV